MVTNIYSMIHMITDFYPKIYDRSPVFLQRFNLCTVARCLKGQKASVAVFCSSSCGQVYRAIGSNSDCCQWCDDWIPNGSLAASKNLLGEDAKESKHLQLNDDNLIVDFGWFVDECLIMGGLILNDW